MVTTLTVIHAPFNRHGYADSHAHNFSEITLRFVLHLIPAIMAGLVSASGAYASQFLTGHDLYSRFGIDPENGFYQVRVEQRVIIRIPRQKITAASNRTTATSPSPSGKPIKIKEKKIGKCLMMDRLIASRPGPKESLELATRDGAVIRAYLGDGCLAREFYAGAYMERPADGKLCVDRDLLHARTGAKCEVEKFRELVPG
jgi:hypothetical protein